MEETMVSRRRNDEPSVVMPALVPAGVEVCVAGFAAWLPRCLRNVNTGNMGR